MQTVFWNVGDYILWAACICLDANSLPQNLYYVEANPEEQIFGLESPYSLELG